MLALGWLWAWAPVSLAGFLVLAWIGALTWHRTRRRAFQRQGRCWFGHHRPIVYASAELWLKPGDSLLVCLRCRAMWLAG